MKNRIKKLIKIGILCFAMALIQTSCEKNDSSIGDELQQEKKISRVSFSDFYNNVTHNRQYQDLEKHFDFNKNSSQSLQHRIDVNDDITLLTDEILLIQRNNISYYTFKIVTRSVNNEFYNLIVHVNNQQQIIKSELYKYIPNSEWLQDINQPYTGQIKVLDNNIISLDDLFSARRNRRCLTGASGHWECNYGNNHAPGKGQSCTSWEYVIDLQYGYCPDEPVEYIVAELPSPRFGGGRGRKNTPNPNPTPSIPTTPCKQIDGTATQTIGIPYGNGNCINLPTYELNLDLEKNPFLLLDIPCNQISQWQEIAQHTIPKSVLNKLQQMNNNSQVPYWDIQELDNAGGKVINMDFFPVTISQFPINPTTNQQYTPQEFFDYFRLNLTSLANNSASNVEFSPSTITGFDEEVLWNSNNPLGAIVSIRIDEDSGSVICSEYDISNTNNNASWFFSTVKAPWTSNSDGDGNHPVSGHRKFGYYKDSNGSYVFYVRGVDRFFSQLNATVADIFSVTDEFSGADDLWNTFQTNINNYVNSNGGNSQINTDIIWRPDWDKVKEVLNGTKSIIELGCD